MGGGDCTFRGEGGCREKIRGGVGVDDTLLESYTYEELGITTRTYSYLPVRLCEEFRGG